MVTCPRCGGDGWLDVEDRRGVLAGGRDCPECEGTGEVWREEDAR